MKAHFFAVALVIFCPPPVHADDFQNGLAAANSGDYVRAFALWEPLAQSGHAKAQNNLGVMYRNGNGVAQDLAEAEKWFRLAADQGIDQAQNSIAFLYYEGLGRDQDHLEAMKWFRLAAGQGLAISLRMVGWMHYQGEGVEQNYAEAAKWLAEAAERGDASAMTTLGVMFHNGQGVDRDDAEAARFFRLAAEKGDPEAQANLGILYQSGLGVPLNLAEAARLFHLAAEKGVPRAQTALGLMYLDGSGVTKNSTEAMRLLSLAASQGDTMALEMLASSHDSAPPVQAQPANEDRLSSSQMEDILSQMAPGLVIGAEDHSVNEPLIYFVIQKGTGSVYDIEEEDVFTKEKKYTHSEASCGLEITFFTPILNQRVYVGSEGSEFSPQTLVLGLHAGSTVESFNFWVGGFSSSNMLETQGIHDVDFDLTYGTSSATAQSSLGEFPSRQAAEQAIAIDCELSRYDRVELYDAGLFSDGILLEGAPKRVPFFGNSTVLLMK